MLNADANSLLPGEGTVSNAANGVDRNERSNQVGSCEDDRIE